MLALLDALPANYSAYIGLQERSGGAVSLTHGDLWCNNIMYASGVDDEGTVTATDAVLALVDWQCAGLGMHTTDLPFLLLSSLDTDLRRAHTNDILRAYHTELVARLRANKLLRADETYEFAELQKNYELAVPHGLLATVASPSCFKCDDADRQVRYVRLGCASPSVVDDTTSQATLQRRMAAALYDGMEVLQDIARTHGVPVVEANE